MFYLYIKTPTKVEVYEHWAIADILTVLYDDFVYLLQGVNDFNVSLNGV